MAEQSTGTEWYANKSDYDEYLTPDVDSLAELYGRLKALTDEYEHVVLTSQFSTGPTHNREVKEEELSYDRARDTLDIYGQPATGRFPSLDNFRGIKVWEY